MQIIRKKDTVFNGALFYFQSHLPYTCIQCDAGFQGEWTECSIGVCPNKECKTKLDEHTPYICNRLRMDIRRHIQKYYQVISIFFSVRVKWYDTMSSWFDAIFGIHFYWILIRWSCYLEVYTWNLQNLLPCCGISVQTGPALKTLEIYWAYFNSVDYSSRLSYINLQFWKYKNVAHVLIKWAETQ